MNRITMFTAIGAVAFALAGCTVEEDPITKAEADVLADETMAPAAPEAASGAVAPANSLNGSYNLRSSECGQAASEGALTVEGTRFSFYEAQCNAVSTTIKGDAAETQLSCGGEGQAFTRLVLLRLSPGTMQMEENGVNLRYYRCPTPGA
ncbi:hypothetical protein FQV27_11640 [Paracoccus aurantiacus]|uniref:DUF3617 family protein n=1 Tax=Paracoccus aurantiacus TaxID=2599412 RepID=A0A5C6S2H9_9RHOB|nr:hypothetical protein [Paracoccus aurantiacus]TXB68632.1 hypothetical protein FQV27_11640 [Paracoccus aurantiacus]